MAITNYADFVATTGPAILTGPEQVVNDAAKNSYLLRQLLKGKPMKEVLQGGQTIDDVIQFEGGGTFKNYGVDDTFTPTNKQITDTISVPWRFSSFSYTIADQESLLQGTAEMTAKARFHRFKRLQSIKEQGAWTDAFNGMEDSLTAVPDSAEMETNGGKQPQSIFSLISPDETNFHPSGYTTVQTIDPATVTGWRNPVSTYDHTSPGDADSGLIAAFDDLIEDVEYESPGIQPGMTEPEGIPQGFFITSKQGITAYKRQIRASNDRLVGSNSPQDPGYSRVKYDGMDIKKISNLATAAVYTSAVEASGEARFYFINPKYLKIVFHSQRFFEAKPPMRDISTPNKQTFYYDVYWNLFIRSRKRGGGVIAPASPTN